MNHNQAMDGQTRSNIQPGMKVRVVEKQNQRTGQLTEGVVQRILTKSPNHQHGIKVMLENGILGPVKEIITHTKQQKIQCYRYSQETALLNITSIVAAHRANGVTRIFHKAPNIYFQERKKSH